MEKKEYSKPEVETIEVEKEHISVSSNYIKL